MSPQAASSKAAQDAQIRLQLNLKNLRRHDPNISAIVGQAAYVGAYWNDGNGWVKANVEGPMFLFQRDTTPQFGFFILNRNGLEYVQELLVADSEVKLEGEFILFEGPNADRATGIWVHDKAEREKLCGQMEDLRKLSAPRPAAAPAPQSISLDALFGAARSPPTAAPQPQPQFHQPPPQQQQFQQQQFAQPQQQQPFPPFQQQQSPPPGQGLNVQQLMNQMMQQPPSFAQPPFQSPPPQQQQQPQQPIGGMGLLDAMFKSAKSSGAPSPTPAVQPLPQPQPTAVPQKAQQATSPIPTFVGSPPGAGAAQPLDAGALLAMIGLGSPTGPLPLGLPLASPPPAAAPLPSINGAIKREEPAPAPAPAQKTVASPPPAVPSPATSNGGAKTPRFGAPLISHDLFASIAPPQQKMKEKIVKPIQSPPPPKVEPEPVLVKEEPAPKPVAEEVEEPAPVVAAPAEEVPKVEDKQEEVVPLPLTPEPAAAPVAVEAVPSAAPSPRPVEVPSTTATPPIQSPSIFQSPAMRVSPAIGRPGASSRASSVSMGLGLAPNGAVEMPSKDVVLQLLDDEVKRVGLGMDGQQPEDDEDEREPLDKSVFIRGVKELLAKGAFSTALYSKYLARFAEELEDQ